MTYDENLAERARRALTGHTGLTERKMFGGLAFLINGHMCCGIVGDQLMLRLGAELASDALRRPHVHPMDFTGRPMKGMVFVTSEGVHGAALKRWIAQAVRHVDDLPPKRPPKLG